MKRAFLIHGWGGYPEEGWLLWLKKELEKLDFEVFVPAMPDTNYPKRGAWLEKLRKTVGEIDKECYFVGHSLGCITILRYLENLKENHEVGGVVLVAGFSDININLDESEDSNEIKSFFETNVDFEKIKKHCEKFVAIHSDNDPYVHLRYADVFKEKLNAEVVVKKDMKHFSGDDGVDRLPVALEVIKEML